MKNAYEFEIEVLQNAMSNMLNNLAFMERALNRIKEGAAQLPVPIKQKQVNNKKCTLESCKSERTKNRITSYTAKGTVFDIVSNYSVGDEFLFRQILTKYLDAIATHDKPNLMRSKVSVRNWLAVLAKAGYLNARKITKQEIKEYGILEKNITATACVYTLVKEIDANAFSLAFNIIKKK